MEQALGGPYLPVAVLPEKDKLLLAKMESRLPLEIFEEVLRAATDACQQVCVWVGEVAWLWVYAWPFSQI